MSIMELLNRIKDHYRSEFRKLYHEVKNSGLDEKEWGEFFSWFWKVRPNFEPKVYGETDEPFQSERGLVKTEAPDENKDKTT